jgi:hypothetical protein
MTFPPSRRIATTSLRTASAPVVDWAFRFTARAVQ